MFTQAKLKKINNDFETEYFKSCGINNPIDFLNPVNPFDKQRIWEGYCNLGEGWKLIHKSEHIVILCDTDMDGLLSSSLLARYLKEYCHYECNIMFHTGDDKHGITQEIIEKLKQERYDLLIIPDAGSGEKDITNGEYLIHNNIVKNILVLDHHVIKATSDLICMVNCKSPYNNTSKTNPFTSGTGVVWHFIAYHAHTRYFILPEDSLSYVAFSLISDVCNLSLEDNYRFIKYGLQWHNIESSLQYIWDIIASIESPTPTGITWKLVPRINCLFRYNEEEDQEVLYELWKLLAHYTEENQKEICNTITHHMAQRHRQQQRDVAKWSEEIESQLDLSNKVFIIDGSKYPARFFGLIASRIEGKFHKPTLMVNYRDDLWQGSVRTSNTQFFQKCIDSGLFTFVDGHPEGAFGVGFEGSKSQDIVNYFEHLNLDKGIIYPVTLVIEPTQIPNSIFQVTEKYSYLWGKNIEEPTIGIYRIPINGSQIQEIGRNKTTIKFFYEGVWYIKFFCSKEWKQQNHIGENVNLWTDLIGSCHIDNYKGIITNQIKINYMETSIRNEEESWKTRF